MWWLMACGWLGATAPQTMTLEGVQVQLPGGFEPLEAEALEARLQAAHSAAPGQSHTLAVQRSDDLEVQLQQSLQPGASALGATPAAVLQAVEDDLRAAATDGDVVAIEREGGRELCVSATTTHTCAWFGVDEDRQLQVLGITCTGPARGCAEVLATRAYAPGVTLPSDASLVDPSALPGPGGAVFGVELGSSREAFRAACREAGHTVDAYDWSTEPAAVRAWVEAGRASRCNGLPVAPTLGAVQTASAVFEDDHLFGLTVHLQADLETVQTALAERYPLAVQGANQVLFVIDDAAADDELVSVTLFATESPTLTFMSQRGYAREER
ncbi:MAG: hypothetical protein KTR31_09005 [Myxococcales bacterium]|nr:hypothetical protein [Myxococcales bacterium]